LFGTQELSKLEQPNPDQTLGEFLILLEFHASYAGNAYIHQGDDGLRLLHPSWVSVVLGSDENPENPGYQLDSKVAGYIYQPGGSAQFGPAVFLEPKDVVHYRPEPDPACWWRGLSWVQGVLAEYVSDRAATVHTQAFFEHSATPQLVFSLDPNVTAEQVKEYAELVARGHSGAANAYKNLFIGGGADVTVVGSDLSKIGLMDVQGGFENRVAVRSRVPVVVLGTREGLQGSALNAGNYQVTRRLWADGWFAPYAQNLCAVIERALTKPGMDVELTFDQAQVQFLQEDRQDEAKIRNAAAVTARQLIDSGWTAESTKAYLATGDVMVLEHTGLVSVQMAKPGAQDMGGSPDNDDGNPGAPAEEQS
jgi:phage portal protein BeeE